jgi:hypothetical protein
MRVRDVLLEDIVPLDRGMNPCYDKYPDEPAYVVSEDGTSILLVSRPARVFVPMVEGLEADATTLTLVKTAAQEGSTGIEWNGGFNPVQEHFNEQSLPFDVVLKHPDSPQLVPPQGVRTIEATGVETDRFYCLTTSEHLGRRPTRPGKIVCDIQCPDTVGLLIFNPKGILTVFLETEARHVNIAAQS